LPPDALSSTSNLNGRCSLTSIITFSLAASGISQISHFKRTEHVTWIRHQVIRHCNRSNCVAYSTADVVNVLRLIHEFELRLQVFIYPDLLSFEQIPLTRFEKLQLINVRPSSEAQLMPVGFHVTSVVHDYLDH